jgi:nucleotide-binding universal stress UspA family protein
MLLATDGSEDSQRAVKTAIGLSTKLDSELHVVYVAPEYPYLHAYYNLRHQEEEQRLRREAQRRLDECVDYIRQAGGIIAHAYPRMGEPAKEIVELAEKVGVGLVIVGSRGHGPIRRALMGSVSTSVVRHAHCSVLVVRGYDGTKQAERGSFLGKIVAATHDSEEASWAMHVATEVAKTTSSEVRLVYAMQEERYRPHLGREMWEGWQEGFEQARRSARWWVEEQADRMRSEGAKTVEPHLLLGRPDAAIVWLAEEIGAGLVVVGSEVSEG